LTPVKGTGYTNHCPQCLYSKHVDINPGDRLSPCQGRMRAIGKTRTKKKGIVLYHQCQDCKMVKKNKVSDFDNPDAILSVPWDQYPMDGRS